ncbi:MAG: glycosyltransferase [Polyangiaceae bacterium]
MSDPHWSFVIPVYGSEASLEATVRELVRTLDDGPSFEIVLVEDASPDGVGAIVDELAREDPRIVARHLARNLGQHRATLLGFELARGSVVITLDDDGQNPPSAALAVGRALTERDLDVVYGRFEAVEQGALRRLASGLNRWLTRHTLENRRDIAISNVRALRGDLARQLGRARSPYPYIDALIFRMTARIDEVGVEHRRRALGGSSYSLGKLVALWLSHLTSLSVLPLRVAMFGSFALSALGFLGGVLATIRALVSGGAPLGWLSLFCAITFLFSVLFAFLGIVSAYLGRMYVSLNERGLVYVRERGPNSDDGGEGEP